MNRQRYLALGFLGVSAAWTLSCSPTDPPESASEAINRPGSARELAQRILIVDSHVDVPYRLQEKMEDIGVRTSGGDFDYPRAKEGGLDAPFMSIYIPASLTEPGEAKQLANELIDTVESFETKWPQRFTVAHSVQEVREAFEKGLIALPLGMENGSGIEDDLDNLKHFYDRGIRYITLTHSENNLIGDSSYATEKKWGGLSPFGREVVLEMNRLGVMIDVSHVSDSTFKQVVALSQAPVIASHSSCRHFVPGFERNMSDDMIRALARGGGVIQINFGSAFILKESNQAALQRWRDVQNYAEEQGLEPGDPKLEHYSQQYREDHPTIFADIEDVVDHIDHVVQLVGVEHVGFGSDFDGVGDSLPTGLKDVADYPNLLAKLLDRGYSEEDLRKISGENLLRVWSEVEAVAANSP